MNIINSLMIIHDSQALFFRNPFGAVACNEKIVLRLEVYCEKAPQEVILRLWKLNREEERICMHLFENFGKKKVYQGQITVPDTPGLLWYYFIVVFAEVTYYYGNNEENLGGIGRICEHEPPSYQITVHKKKLKIPNWFKDAVMYQIFVDRFYNDNEKRELLHCKQHCYVYENWADKPYYRTDEKTGKVVCYDFFGGNLSGVLKKLSYLKELGINVIYFNPLFEAPSNHKYDTSDYKKIDPQFGDNKLFKELCQNARDYGISIILDGVFSHTGSDSIYFNKEGNYPSLGAYQSKESPFYPWYNFYDYPDSYDCWWDTETLPNVNELEPGYQNFIIHDQNSVLKYWIKMGTRGWRLDVADELPEEFIMSFCKVMKEADPKAILIGEVWEDASNKISYDKLRRYLLGDQLDSVMNYPWRKIMIEFILGEKDAYQTHRALMSLYENYPQEHFYATMNLIGSHDVPRILTILGEAPPGDGLSEKEKSCYSLPPEQKKLALARLRLLVVLQMTFPGTPCIYYGDEVGMEGYGDPHCRATYPWGKENRGLLYWYKQLISLRHNYPVLKTGKWSPFYAEGDVYGYVRLNEKGKDVFNRPMEDNVAVVLCSRNINSQVHLSVDISQWCSGELIDVLNGKRKISLKNGILQITLKSLESKVLLQCLSSSERSGKKYSRACGILLHPTSLPSQYGVGDFGNGAYQFVDFLERSGQKLWQVLPLNPPGCGESPYQALSAFAGNPLLISIEGLLSEGLLTSRDLADIDTPIFNSERVLYKQVKPFKEELLRRAFNRFKSGKKPDQFLHFIEENAFWLTDYTLFITLKNHFKGAHWINWEASISNRKPAAIDYYRNLLQDEIFYHSFLQYVFFRQWMDLKEYANRKGIKIIGDISIYVGHDSCDVWSKQEMFKLDKAGRPLVVAGVPPDYFSETGQLWGHPVYRWDIMAKNDYYWWRQRFKNLLRVVDLVRLDHFRGFTAYWEIPYGKKTAVNGKWMSGPGEAFFNALKKEFGEADLPIIAEDLGIITPDVVELKESFGFPGMQVLQFSLESQDEKEFLPQNHPENLIVYTGTHDNDTLMGWYRRILEEKPEIIKLLEDYFFLDITVGEMEVCRQLIEIAYRSNARTVIIPLQDILGLGNEARMNLPGSVEGNWNWRFTEQSLTEEVSAILYSLVKNYGR